VFERDKRNGQTGSRKLKRESFESDRRAKELRIDWRRCPIFASTKPPTIPPSE
jgi:hypothetical protein